MTERCEVCGSALRVRQLVDYDQGAPFAELECVKPECRALHLANGTFAREHPETGLRREWERRQRPG